MKKDKTKKTAFLILAMGICLLNNPAYGQIFFSRFDFNTADLKLASIGPNGLACDPDAASNGTGYYMTTNCASTKGLDLEIPNPGALFDCNEMGMTFNFQRDESQANFFQRGGTQFYISGNIIYIQYRTDDGFGGFTNYGPFNTGYSLINDDIYREYTFEYRMTSGIARILVNGSQVWTFDGPDMRNLYWGGAGIPLVGAIMDGNCMGRGILDYVSFYTPDPLPVQFTEINATREEKNVRIQWNLENISEEGKFIVKKSTNGNVFSLIGEIGCNGNDHLIFVDENPGPFELYYCILYVDENGTETQSPIAMVPFFDFKFTAWPNPAHGTLSVETGIQIGRVQLALLNMEGAVILNTEGDGGQIIELDISNISSGTYILMMNCGSINRSIKIAVE